ncbi:MAG: hypothetical protein H0W33_01000 [Gammaproteobacteria bacterium]|nr:hypothetical protein [Gammaproteobacteria bacterium]
MQTVYACSEIGEQLRTACCCAEADSNLCGAAESCESDLVQAAQACCDISYSAGFDDEAVFTSAAQAGKSGTVPLALPPSSLATPAVGAGILFRNAASSFDSGPRSAIYLTTRRLRI